MGAASPSAKMARLDVFRLWINGAEVNAVDDEINLINGITATAGEINVLAGVTPGTTAASSALVVDSTKNLDTLSITTLKLGSAGGTAVTSTAAEINVLHSVTAGTAAASSALVLGASKNVDTIAIAAGGLHIGAAGGTSVTSTAAELNVLHSVTAGTAAASSALVLGTNKNIDTIVIAASGLKIGSGAGTAVTSVAADLNLVSGMVAAAAGVVKVAKIALAAVDTSGGVFSWQNPESGTIVVNRLTIIVGTVAAGACAIICGTTAVSGTTTSNNLIDTLDVHSATGSFDNVQNPGSGGKPLQALATGKWVTGSKTSGASSGLVGFAYIEYFLE